MEVLLVESDIAYVVGVIITWVSVVAAILAWFIGLGMIPDVNEAFIILIDLIGPIFDALVD
jgi:hypothetical protein